MSTVRPLMTALGLEQIEDDGYRYDLLRGELIQMPLVTREQAKIIGNFFRSFGNFVDENQLGEVYAPETGFLLETNPDTVLAPDVSFVRQKRLSEIAEVDGYIPLAPDLAVEVICGNFFDYKLAERIQVLLDAGAKAVIIFNSRKLHVNVYRRSARMMSYTEWLTSSERRDGFPANDWADCWFYSSGTSLDLPDIVPGWSVPLSNVFG